MTPLQKIAMGLVVVVLNANFGGWDGLPDPLGWLLVLSGVRDTRDHLPNQISLLVLGGLAVVISVVTYPPGVTEDLEPAAMWLLDLPQLGFEVALCSALVAALGREGRWYGTLMWLLVAVGIGPAIAIGSDNPSLADATLAGWVLGQLALVWLLFSSSGNPKTGAKPKPVQSHGGSS